MGKFFTHPPLMSAKKRNTQTFGGGVAEWLNAPVLKLYKNPSMCIHLHYF